MIKISQIKQIREELGMTHLVVFAIDKDGQQHFATHGETFANAKEAAKVGNNLKKSLGWPEDLCKSKPLDRICKNCFFWEADYGIHCFNGWSGDGSNGYCNFEPQRLAKSSSSYCSKFEPKN